MKQLEPVTRQAVRLTRRDKGAKSYSEIWELRDGYWHMVYDSEGSAEYEAISPADFDGYARCFHDQEAVEP